MRALLVFLLSFALCVNAAFALGTGLCDSLAHEQPAGQGEHAEHFGHHAHGHLATQAADQHTDEHDEDAGDTCQCLAHPASTSLAAIEFSLPALTGRMPVAAHPPADYASAHLPGPDQPPRARLA